MLGRSSVLLRDTHITS